jgi:hypothetical protein
VIDHGQRLFRRAHAAPAHPQTFEGLGACYLMNEMPVDIKEARAVGLRFDNVIVPDFVVKRSWRAHEYASNFHA